MRPGLAYEELVSTLLDGLRRGTPLHGYTQHAGARNRIIGASGYAHQIDVSVCNSTNMYLFEAKCLHRPIGVNGLLVMAARKADIAEAFPNINIHASMLSTKQATKNVPALAKYFSINVDIIENLYNYGVSFSNTHFIGFRETAIASSSMDAEVIPKNGKEQPQ